MQNKDNNKQVRFIYMILLALYPLLRVGQGLSIMDTTYSLSNFAHFSEMSGTWMVATYMANVVGSGLMGLPFGHTMLGFNIYSSLLVGLTAVFVVMFFKRDIPVPIIFVGEIIALSLCWCPTTLLYNYLTYLIFTLGTLLLYRALSGGRRDMYVAAGILFGLNVTTRFPNVTEAAMICAVWYVGIIERRKISTVIVNTLMCIGGYLIGFILPLITIAIRFNADAYGNMINSLFAMTDKATDYKPTSMVTAMFSDYIYAGKWIAEFVVACVVCAFIYLCCQKISDRYEQIQYSRISAVCIAVSLVVMGLVTRVVYGQGMFSFRYYEYSSMYFWAILFIVASTIISCIYLFAPEENHRPVTGPELVLHRKKIIAILSLVIMYVTCIGSNNAMFPTVNNLFIVVPYTLFCVYEWAKDLYHKKNQNKLVGAIKFGGCVTVLVIVLALLIQGLLFHSKFALQDGDDGTERTAQITGHPLVNHIYTTPDNAEPIQGVMDYVAEHGQDVEELILFGDVPGFGYLLDKTSALTSFWPDLDSFTYDEWAHDMHEIQMEVQSDMPAPYIITSIEVAAWEGGNPEAIEYFGIDVDEFASDKKLEDLINFMHECGYVQVYCNNRYSVYYVNE